jgi:hypothetical protein
MADLIHGVTDRMGFVAAAPNGAADTTAGSPSIDPEISARRARKALRLAIGYTPRNDLVAARLALGTRIQALEACLECRQPKLKREVHALLKGAKDLLEMKDARGSSHDLLEQLEAAATQYRTAQKVYHGYVHKANRPLYISGVVASAFALAVLPFLLYATSQLLTGFVHEPAKAVFAASDLPSLLILFGFAALGSVASVLTRLDKIEIPDTFTWHLVVAAGAGRPLVAATFASVAYALFKGRIIGLGAVGDPVLAGADLHWWCFVVAFLCGYSERFAKDLLGRSPFGGDGAAAAPAPTGLAARLSTNGAKPHRQSDGRKGSRLREPRPAIQGSTL